MMKNIVSAKFGGSSMGTAKSISECVDIVKELSKNNRVVVSVSAVYKTTDTLIEIINLSKKKKSKLVKPIINLLEKKHFDILNEIGENENIYKLLKSLFKNLRGILEGISLIGDISKKTEAKILSYGEKMSSYLILAVFEKNNIKSERIESEKLIRTDSNYLESKIDLIKTQYFCKKILAPLLQRDIIPITTGFIGKDSFGDTTLLGRGGSDYTGSLIGVCLDAERINIYTDVNGIMSADPKLVKNAVSWNELDIDTASEISYSGAKVVHPKSIFCTKEKKIPIYILNTFDRNFKGTKISSNIDEKGIKGIVGVKNSILITLKSPNMLESLGFIAKASSIISDFGVEIDVLASSEISFTFSIKKEFYSKKLIMELSKKAFVKVKENVAKICIIGDNILNQSDKLLDVFKILSNEKIEILTLSSGGSYNNVTLIIDEKRLDDIVKKLHDNLIK